MIKAKFRVTVKGKIFEKILKMPCRVSHLCTHVGHKMIIFTINTDFMVFDHTSGYLFLRAGGEFYTLKDAFKNEEKAFEAFANDPNWHIPSGLPVIS